MVRVISVFNKPRVKPTPKLLQVDESQRYEKWWNNHAHRWTALEHRALRYGVRLPQVVTRRSEFGDCHFFCTMDPVSTHRIAIRPSTHQRGYRVGHMGGAAEGSACPVHAGLAYGT